MSRRWARRPAMIRSPARGAATRSSGPRRRSRTGASRGPRRRAARGPRGRRRPPSGRRARPAAICRDHPIGGVGRQREQRDLVRVLAHPQLAQQLRREVRMRRPAGAPGAPGGAPPTGGHETPRRPRRGRAAPTQPATIAIRVLGLVHVAIGSVRPRARPRPPSARAVGRRWRAPWPGSTTTSSAARAASPRSR